ncbi:hypothetical protein KA529_00580 [Candidatus Saccharibacteria bacterium]|nr:hypothetical protein [Candidatus Saccharibacteria bacterium]
MVETEERTFNPDVDGVDIDGGEVVVAGDGRRESAAPEIGGIATGGVEDSTPDEAEL